jgi:superfamily II DNA or RNA helicase/diadenosine tetraphosphate (Ap4A) HIT family hydrolase/HKD family nuclease
MVILVREHNEFARETQRGDWESSSRSKPPDGHESTTYPIPAAKCGIVRPTVPAMSLFLTIPESSWVASNELAFAIRDDYPVSDGHTLVIPKRVIARWSLATEQERVALLSLVERVKADLDEQLHPDAYNIGINDGEAAGQTIAHLHIHVIPRWHDDVDDPRGGVRYVIPARGNYKSPGRLPNPRRAAPPWPSLTKEPAARALATGGAEDPFYAHLRPLLLECSAVYIVAAFIQASGVLHLSHVIDQALARGASFKIITGDYLHITQAQALRLLLDWSQTADSGSEGRRGSFEVRVIETEKLGGRAFHPKCWRVEGPASATAWVGSSNWSKSALTDGIEWNLRIDREHQRHAYDEICAAFGLLWDKARRLDSEWLDAYAREAANHTLLPFGEIEASAAAHSEPRGIQPDALDALAAARARGRLRSLVVLATGLGKTFLAAFDVRNFEVELGRPPRVLFLAHRQELLLQAARTFRDVFPDASFGLFVGEASNLEARFVFASVQKLARQEHLDSIPERAFDYVIVDEGHHAAADSYRRILAHISPRFLLGLTATPERADDADVAGLFDDHIAFRADLAEGIGLGFLVPFHYVGVRDTIAYEPIPFRRYTIEHLAELAATQERMETLWRAWQEYPGQRTLVFCVSIGHADYVAGWLCERGVMAAAVHTGPESADREAVIDGLARGTVQAAVAVDLFNEGLDVPLVDRVVMLRPTDSPVVFLQQLGRGLRTADGKHRLQVIDFVGNHKVFLKRLRTLLSLSPHPPSLRQFLASPSELELPPGCSVNIELEAIDLLSKLLPSDSANETIRIYRELRDAQDGRRPTPGELARRGLNPASVRRQHGHWHEFVASEGDLDDAEQAAVREHEDWLGYLENRDMTNSGTMVVLEVLLQHDALYSGVPTGRLAELSHAYLLRNPDLQLPDPATWLADWTKDPSAAWTRDDQRWFVINDGVFRFRKHPPADQQTKLALERLSRHIVDWRLATYRRRVASASGPAEFTCRVTWNKRDPILILPGRGREALPHGPTDVRLEDGQLWSFRFAKIAVNVAHAIGQSRNGLPDLLREWFGPASGRPGTDNRVRFRRGPEGWWIEPLGKLVQFVPRNAVVAYPDLRAAAGSERAAELSPERGFVRLPVDARPNRFAVRVAGNSMDGGHAPLRDGDWVVFEWARDVGFGAVVGRVVLVARGDPDEGQSHHIKRVIQDDHGLHLRSDNPHDSDLLIDDTTVVIARLVTSIRPEELAPTPGALLTDWTEAFGIDDVPTGPWSRVNGHLFILVDTLAEPDRVAVIVADRTPAETAFVLLRSGEAWTYLGVGQWADGSWIVRDTAHR